ELANLYLDVLNPYTDRSPGKTTDPVVAKDSPTMPPSPYPPYPPYPPPPAPADKPKEIRPLRSESKRDNPSPRGKRSIEEAAVPVLLETARQTNNAEVQDRCVETLCKIAPASDDVVDSLQDLLDHTRKPDTRQAIVQALGRIGTRCRKAGPLLDNIACNSTCPVERQLAFESLHRMHFGPYQCGMHDNAHCFTAQGTEKAARLMGDLARHHRVAFVTETFTALPDAYKKAFATDTAKDYAAYFSLVANERSQKLTADGVYVMICQEPPS